MYAIIIQDADRDKLDRFLDEPLPAELSAGERRLMDMRQVADANRAVQQALAQSTSIGRGR